MVVGKRVRVEPGLTYHLQYTIIAGEGNPSLVRRLSISSKSFFHRLGPGQIEPWTGWYDKPQLLEENAGLHELEDILAEEVFPKMNECSSKKDTTNLFTTATMTQGTDTAIYLGRITHKETKNVFFIYLHLDMCQATKVAHWSVGAILQTKSRNSAFEVKFHDWEVVELRSATWKIHLPKVSIKIDDNTTVEFEAINSGPVHGSSYSDEPNGCFIVSRSKTTVTYDTLCSEWNCLFRPPEQSTEAFIAQQFNPSLKIVKCPPIALGLTTEMKIKLDKTTLDMELEDGPEKFQVRSTGGNIRDLIRIDPVSVGHQRGRDTNSNASVQVDLFPHDPELDLLNAHDKRFMFCHLLELKDVCNAINTLKTELDEAGCTDTDDKAFLLGMAAQDFYSSFKQRIVEPEPVAKDYVGIDSATFGIDQLSFDGHNFGYAILKLLIDQNWPFRDNDEMLSHVWNLLLQQVSVLYL